jgi:hypothetical protein
LILAVSGRILVFLHRIPEKCHVLYLHLYPNCYTPSS